MIDDIQREIALAKMQEIIRRRTDVARAPKRPNRLRRNAKCPCGSGLKLKKCCLARMKNDQRGEL